MGQLLRISGSPTIRSIKLVDIAWSAVATRMVSCCDQNRSAVATSGTTCATRRDHSDCVISENVLFLNNVEDFSMPVLLKTVRCLL